jgi:hypothetical protein
MYRKYKGWIGAIFIRKVSDISGLDEEDRNSNERFEKAFKDIPRDIWHVFTDPQELYERIAQLPAVE